MVYEVDTDHIMSQGTLWDGSARIDYYTSTPAPSQWIAVGVMFSNDADAQSRRPRRLVVGNGSCESSAITDMKLRFSRALQEQQAAIASKQSPERDPAPAANRQSIGVDPAETELIDDSDAPTVSH